MASQEYDKLLEKLGENKHWPLLYMFKFIAPNEDGKVKQVVSLLPKNGQISYKHTKNLKFVSITCKVKMPSAQSIVDVSSEINKIKGIIAL
ncbi:DUF493 family protein [Saccharicrinis fermentans]|uniref:DUF493 domain-containing protein n=1 Tax=Saccharicrinis fermentans DSM 9555 = JCM 21142 TaxID=869213 RepID=W7YFH9_9BACT|nr:DUF493 family protein [Saccharicrinis fermentans]GAF03196.1 hypothetical protein JCM21142_41861 [Saccharicrinis fermentans DSM 9555 = JCM 21142]